MASGDLLYCFPCIASMVSMSTTTMPGDVTIVPGTIEFSFQDASGISRDNLGNLLIADSVRRSIVMINSTGNEFNSIQ